MSKKATQTVAHPTIRNRIYLLARTVRTRGIQPAFRHYLTRLNLLLRKRHARSALAADNPDRLGRFSTPPDLGIRSANVKWGVHYAPSREDIFRKAIRSLPIRFEDYVFIDLGAGKGEVLLLAAGCAFRKVIGVEYSETLTALASANVRTAAGLMCHSVECICADAIKFDLSPDPAVLYLYNPFQGRVMDKVVEKIEESLRAWPRDLWIVYVNPWEHRKFVRSHYLKTVVENWDLPTWEFCIYRSVV
jgi:hypothetical protein